MDSLRGESFLCLLSAIFILVAAPSQSNVMFWFWVSFSLETSFSFFPFFLLVSYPVLMFSVGSERLRTGHSGFSLRQAQSTLYLLQLNARRHILVRLYSSKTFQYWITQANTFHNKHLLWCKPTILKAVDSSFHQDIQYCCNSNLIYLLTICGFLPHGIPLKSRLEFA